jgi:transposase-like protein
MSFEYDVAELCTAVKPSLLLALFNRFGEEEVVFFDPDILILRPLEEMREQLASASIVLTPHTLKPIPRDGLSPSEQDLLLGGAYNLGFLALRRSDETLQFLRWWEEHLLAGGAVVDVPKGLMTDQKWIDLVPSLFPSTTLLRDDTYNVAWWNLHHRILSRQGEQFLVNGRPLTFFHFSGFDPSRPRLFTKEYQTRTKVVEGSPLAELLDLYAELHVQNGYGKIKGWRYRYSHFDNGVPVHLILRRLYLDLDTETRERFGDPFRVDGADSFFDWATQPQPAEANLSPFLLSLYQSRSDLWSAFPDIRGADRAAFLEWAWTHGAHEMKYDPQVMRLPEGNKEGGTRDAERAKKEPSPTPRALRHANGIPPKHVRHYQQIVRTIGEAVRAALPPAVTVLVISKGDDELLTLLEQDGRKARHFPQTKEGSWAGHNPADSAEAIAHLEELRAKGANFLLLPAPARWWLDHYRAFRQHLEKHYRKVLDQEETCLIFALGQSESD